jgi:putative transferase (TIGR04331 family)
LAVARIYVDHKPYSQGSVDFLHEYYADLARIGGPYYQLLISRQKGLSPALLKDYRAVLWDQIGTGTLDCFVTRIPTMIYWERIYSRESAQARPLIAELENVGVVHASSDSLVREMSHMLADPHAWMQDKRRQAAIAQFCNLFARTDRRWPALWRKALRELDERKVDKAVFVKTGE